ncbi:hypothetical protein NJBCHELONAE_05980 [Mycobacteroides chelonae]|uniref:hypothetical protein n=1 Tax=Mycobacteroides chelonae TaxID=1774 RepID=UPI0021DDBBCF|nr:hypothetical protein [Mycobacteroides chelonae]GLE55287.1 hypothetical protein NJBCHELONAE_05980 [Mycobacteroides chelonae]
MKRIYGWLGAICIAVLLVAGGMIAWHVLGSNRTDESRTYGTPPELLVHSIPRSKPTPNWTVELSGLISGTELRQSLVEIPGRNLALVFVYSGDPLERGKTSWLYGLNPINGDVLFSPLALDGPVFGCYANGAERAVCLSGGPSGAPVAADTPSTEQAWVVDTVKGQLLYAGPTDLNADAAHNVGKYLVVSERGKGWFGVGDHAERTWFVPGDGERVDGALWSRDVAPQELVAGKSLTDSMYSLFSVIDGSVIKKNLQYPPWLYAGGYAIAARSTADPGSVTFFDNRGNQVNRMQIQPDEIARVMTTFGEALVLDFRKAGSSKGDWKVFNAKGDKIAEFPAVVNPESPRVRIIGNKLFASDNIGIENTFRDNPWKQVDLVSGAFLRTCANINLLGYAGSDGQVVLTRSSSDIMDVSEQAFDSASCTQLWTIDTRQEGLIERVNTALVQISDSKISGVTR